MILQAMTMSSHRSMHMLAILCKAMPAFMQLSSLQVAWQVVAGQISAAASKTYQLRLTTIF